MAGSKKTAQDLIGESPRSLRNKKRKAEEDAKVDPEIEKERLRKMALEKGLNPTF